MWDWWVLMVAPLGNLMVIGLISIRCMKKELRWHTWWVAPVSNIQYRGSNNRGKGCIRSTWRGWIIDVQLMDSIWRCCSMLLKHSQKRFLLVCSKGCSKCFWRWWSGGLISSKLQIITRGLSKVHFLQIKREAMLLKVYLDCMTRFVVVRVDFEAFATTKVVFLEVVSRDWFLEVDLLNWTTSLST